TGCCVHCIQVLENDELGGGSAPRDCAFGREHEDLRDFLAEFGADPDAVEEHVVSGTPAYEICNLAAKVGADLVIVGTHGRRGLSRLWLGSCSEAVVREAPCPVLVVRPKLLPGATR